MSAVDVVRRRISGSYVVDEAGLDPDLARVAASVLGIGWRIRVDGAERIPTGPALLVHNRRVGPAETFAVARGIGAATGRWVRFLGVPDVDPLGPLLRKLGGASAHPAEAAGLLRAGNLVSVAQRPSIRARPAPDGLPAALAAVAADLSVPVVPVSVRGGLGSWRLTVA